MANLPTPTPYNPDTSRWSRQYPRTALNVMEEIAGRIGTPLDPRTTIPGVLTGEIEDTALDMTMREVAGYIAAQNGGNWTITDAGYLYLVPLGVARALADENGMPLLFGEVIILV